MSLWQKKRGHERLKPKVLLAEMTAQQVSPKISCLLFLDPKAAKAQLSQPEVTLVARAAGFFSAFTQLDKIRTEPFLCRHQSPDEFLFLPRVAISADRKMALNSQPVSSHWPVVQESGSNSRLKLMEGCCPWEPINNPQLIKHWYSLIGRSNSIFPSLSWNHKTREAPEQKEALRS